MRKHLKLTAADMSDMLQEIEALRPVTDTRARQFTQEQDAALLAARTRIPQVPWAQFIAWWTARWEPIGRDTLLKRLRYLTADRS